MSKLIVDQHNIREYSKYDSINNIYDIQNTLLMRIVEKTEKEVFECEKKLLLMYIHIM